jgi:hypothetical protein
MNISPGVRKSLVELFPYLSNHSEPPAATDPKIERERLVALYAAS